MRLAIVFALLPCLAIAGIDIKFLLPSRVMIDEPLEFASYEMPVGPYGAGEIPILIAEGPWLRKVWRVRLNGGGTLDVMDSLRQQIETRGFELLFECETATCGGFDFRFNTEIAPEPDMHVDLGDFRYLSAQRLGGAIPEYLSLLVSRGGDRGYIQMISVGSSDVEVITPTNERNEVIPSDPVTEDTLITVLETTGAVPLDDLVFPSGSSELGEGEFETLQALADYLNEDATRKVVLVGHTDAVGSLQGNIALSKTRAQSVVARLTKVFGVSVNQVSAEGNGYLTPRSSNQTDDGRGRNRRVEAVLLPAE